LSLFPQLDSIKTNTIDLISADSSFLNCSPSNLIQLTDSTIMVYGGCQKLGLFNGHLELINWAAILDTNLNVLQQRMYPRTAANQPLRLNFYNAIKAPDGGVIFGTEGRLVPNGILPQFGGLTKLDSNLNVEWEYIFPTPKVDEQLSVSQLFTFTLPNDSNHFYAFQTYGDSCTLDPRWVHCNGWTNQLFNRRFLKFNWAGQLVSQNVEETKKQGYMAEDIAVDEKSIVVSGGLRTWYLISGYVERYNHNFDILWHVQPDAGMPVIDTTAFQPAFFWLSSVATSGDKIIAGGQLFDPNRFPDPYQFAYITVIDTNGHYLDGTPIGFWLSAAEEVKDLEIKVYPQPASTHVHVAVAASAGATKLVLSDLSGRTVLQAALAPYTDVHEVSVAHLPGGTYLLQLENESGVFYVTRLVVRR